MYPASQDSRHDGNYFAPSSTGEDPADCPAGTVAKTDPSGDSVRGGIITLYISKGPGNAAPLPPGGGGGGGGGGPGDRKCKLFPWLCQPGTN